MRPFSPDAVWEMIPDDGGPSSPPRAGPNEAAVIIRNSGRRRAQASDCRVEAPCPHQRRSIKRTTTRSALRVLRRSL